MKIISNFVNCKNVIIGMDKQSPIGVFDSGIGGLSVLKQYLRILPSEKYIYLGDTARVPYGNKSVDTVNRYAAECTKFLLEKDVKLIVIACNTVSAVALEKVKEIAGDVPVIGMINYAAKAAIQMTNNGKIGIIGTRATINSNAYTNSINSYDINKDILTFSQECPLLVPLVEEGLFNHPASKLIVDDYLSYLKQVDIDVLILGCTHYPLLNKLISEVLPKVNLIDTGEQAAINSIRLLAENGLLIEDNPQIINKFNIEFYVTDMPSQFNEMARNFLGFNVESINLTII